MAAIVPTQLIQKYREMHGEAGAAWAEGLPSVVADLEARWNVRVESVYPLSYNWVARAVNSAGEPVVLKIGWPGEEEVFSEMAALCAFDGRGIAQLLAYDGPSAAMLLECIEPGVPLEQMADDDEATRIAAQVMRELWVEPPEQGREALITVARWGMGFQKLHATFGGGTGPFSPQLVERAERTWAELEASPAHPPMLLHGDLHHWNILSAQRSPWLAIDPKGLIGEPAYEPGALLRNPWPDVSDVPLLLERLPRRVAIIHEMLGLDRQRILAWSFTQAVLSSWWTYEETRAVGEQMIAFAEGHQALLDG